MDDVFISYAREDLECAERIAAAIAALGYTVWWDHSIPVGRSFSDVIERELDSARCVVVLWSRVSVISEWVLNEAAEGARRKILVPVRIEHVRMPLEFRRLHTANLTNWRISLSSRSFADCAAVIRTLVSHTRDEQHAPSASQSALKESSSSGPMTATPDSDRSGTPRIKRSESRTGTGATKALRLRLLGLIVLATLILLIWVFALRDRAPNERQSLQRQDARALRSDPSKASEVPEADVESSSQGISSSGTLGSDDVIAAVHRTRPVALYKPVPLLRFEREITCQFALIVTARGAVADVAPRVPCAPHTATLISTIKTWRFKPAEEKGHAVSAPFTVDITFPAGDP